MQGDLRDLNTADDSAYGEETAPDTPAGLGIGDDFFDSRENDYSAAARGLKKVSYYRSKRRKRIAAGLAAAVLSLGIILGGIFYKDIIAAIVPAAAGGDTDFHQDEGKEPFAPRDARRYLGAKDIAWEINLGGTGEDILGEVFEINELFYLFGQTNSTDYDFKGQDSGDLFMCTMNQSGRVLTSTTFGTDHKDTFIKVRFNESGFFLLAMTGGAQSSATVFNIGFDGIVKDAYTYPSPQTILPKDIYAERNMVYICAEIQNQTTNLKSPLFFALDNQLVLQWRQQPDSTNFEFVAMYPGQSGFVALFNGDIAGQKYPVLCRFNKLSTTTFFYLKQHAGSNNVFAADMIPSDNGSFLILISDEGNGALGSVIKVSQTLLQTAKLSTEIRQCAGGRLYAGGGDKFYAVLSYAGSARGRLIIDGVSGLSIAKADGINDVGTPSEYLINTGRVLFLSTTDIPLTENIMVTSIDESFARQFQNTYGGKGKDTAKCIFNSGAGDGLVVFGSTDSTGGDIGKNFGRTDIWAFKIKAV